MKRIKKETEREGRTGAAHATGDTDDAIPSRVGSSSGSDRESSKTCLIRGCANERDGKYSPRCSRLDSTRLAAGERKRAIDDQANVLKRTESSLCTSIRSVAAVAVAAGAAAAARGSLLSPFSLHQLHSTHLPYSIAVH